MIFETDSSSECLSYIISSFPKLQTLPFQTVHFYQVIDRRYLYAYMYANTESAGSTYF